jgi:hypothetical protein
MIGAARFLMIGWTVSLGGAEPFDIEGPIAGHGRPWRRMLLQRFFGRREKRACLVAQLHEHVGPQRVRIGASQANRPGYSIHPLESPGITRPFGSRDGDRRALGSR